MIDMLSDLLLKIYPKKSSNPDFHDWAACSIGAIIVISYLLPSKDMLYAHHILLPILIIGSLLWLGQEINIKIGHLVIFLSALLWLHVHFILALAWDGDVRAPLKSIFLVTILFFSFIIFEGQDNKLKTLSAALIASTIILLVANAQWFGEHRFTLFKSYFDFSGYSSPNVSGMFLALISVFAFWRCLFAQSPKQFVVFFFPFLILFTATVTTNSRGALLSLISGLIILFWTKLGARMFFWNVTKLSCLLLFFVFLDMETNIFDTTLYKNDFGSGRFDIWSLAISYITETPWTVIFGKGPTNIEFVLPYRLPIHSPHNSFLHIAYLFGLPTLLLFIVVLACNFFSILHTKNNMYFSIKCALFGFAIVQMLIDSHLFSTQFGWLLLFPLVFTGHQLSSETT